MVSFKSITLLGVSFLGMTAAALPTNAARADISISNADIQAAGGVLDEMNANLERIAQLSAKLDSVKTTGGFPKDFDQQLNAGLGQTKIAVANAKSAVSGLGANYQSEDNRLSNVFSG